MTHTIQKTHYEVLKDLFDKNKILPGLNFQQFIGQVSMGCNASPSYDEFCLSEPLQKHAPSLCISQRTIFANVLFHIYCLRQHHERIYYICPKMAINLARTDLNVDTYFLKAPFPEVYLSIDPGLYYIKDQDMEYPVRGFYVNLQEKNSIKEIRIMVVALNISKGTLEEDAIFYFKLYIGSGKIKDLVKTYIDDKVKNNIAELQQFGGIHNVEAMEDLFFFVFNSLLYITSRNADIVNQLPVNSEEKLSGLKSTRKIQKFLRRQSKTTALPITVVGSKTLSPHSLEGVKSSGGIGKWKLEKRLYIPGHWRSQWYGSEKDNSRHAEVIFIQPYEKGPEFTEVVDKRYQIGKS